MKKAMKRVSELIGSQDEAHIRKNIAGDGSSDFAFYANSVHKKNDILIAMARDQVSRFLIVMSRANEGFITRFTGELVGDSGIFAKKCPLTEENAVVIRELFPWTVPVPVLRSRCSIGCGDRLGLASAAHAGIFAKYDAKPVFAQQSIRELKLTNRTYRSVIDDACFLTFQAGYKDGFGADGDHLKNEAHINMALAAGVTMLTLDLSDELKPDAANMSCGELDSAFNKLPESLRKRLITTYVENSPSDLVKFSREELMRCAVIYSSAMDFAATVGRMLESNGAGKVDLEISIDETTTPTEPEDHFFVANELLYRNVKFCSLAPRFIGEFQKGIDYIGNIDEFRRQLALHVAIAKKFGNYKISVHSGSDKFKAFPAIGELTGGHFHLKTAGTSWLEAVRAISVRSPKLFRSMYRKALVSLDDARKLYHVTADFKQLPDLALMPDSELPSLLECVPGRQLLHITYGSMLADEKMHADIYAALHANEQTYNEMLAVHFDRHLSLLGVPLRK